jgi:hypothetical protein
VRGRGLVKGKRMRILHSISTVDVSRRFHVLTRMMSAMAIFRQLLLPNFRVAEDTSTMQDSVACRTLTPTARRTLCRIARWRGHRATYPQISRTELAPRGLKASA